MVRADLLGRHEHRAPTGQTVQIWQRGVSYLARGRHEGKQFGVTLGKSEQDAEAALLHLFREFDQKTFVPPSSPQAKRRRERKKPSPQLDLAELTGVYLEAKRLSTGRKTANTYGSRLNHVLVFWEQREVKRRYPLAEDLDASFASELRGFLQRRKVARNGHPNAARDIMSPRQVRNILESLRDLLGWAAAPGQRWLPANFVQPVTPDVIGRAPKKDPLRPMPLPLERRLRLVRMADAYQLIHLGPSLALPLRPEQITGLLVNEIDWAQQTLAFGTRFDESDFTKGQTSFRVPFPDQLEPLLRAAVGGRGAGPVLQSRAVYERRQAPRLSVQVPGDLERAVERAVQPGAAGPAPAPQDRKEVVRRLLRDAGGADPDGLAEEFRRLRLLAGMEEAGRFYDTRASVESELQGVGVPVPYQRYVMGHDGYAGGTLDAYLTFDLEKLRAAMQLHWEFASELLAAIEKRGRFLGIWTGYEVAA